MYLFIYCILMTFFDLCIMVMVRVLCNPTRCMFIQRTQNDLEIVAGLLVALTALKLNTLWAGRKEGKSLNMKVKILALGLSGDCFLTFNRISGTN